LLKFAALLLLAAKNISFLLLDSCNCNCSVKSSRKFVF
jgi:hypothetical protein